MMKIYTPKEWSGVFRGAASLVIDDDGYIYDGNRSGVGSSPIGKIEYDRREIYGNDYGSFVRTPIAYMMHKRNHIEIYANDGRHTGDPMLYIMDDKIYTPQEWSRSTGTPDGFIDSDGKGTAQKIAKGAAVAAAASGSGWGILAMLVAVCAMCGPWIVNNPELFLLLIVGIIVLCCKKSKKKKAKAVK